MPSTTNLEGEEIVDAPGKDGKALMPEQVKRPNPWRMMMMIMMIIIIIINETLGYTATKPDTSFSAKQNRHGIPRHTLEKLNCLFLK
jgi:hypothetical protein